MRPNDGTNVSSAVPATVSVIALWVNGIALIGSVLLAAGAGIAFVRPAMLLSPHEPITEGVRIYAGYLISRNAALALFLLAAVLFRVRTLLASMLLLVGCVQIFDACIDLVEGRWTLVPGIAVLGLLFLLAAAKTSPFLHTGQEKS